MKIAVTYKNGAVFQHFGSTEAFKIYEIKDNKIQDAEIIESNGIGHGALAGLIAGYGVDVLICGGLGGGAQQALAEAGIEVVSGAEGNTDDAVEAYLRGDLVSAGVNCDHHDSEHGEEHQCNGSGGCGGGCGGGGGCHSQPKIEGKNVGRTCSVHYKGTFNDGTVFDSSYDRGEPLEFMCGIGMMIRGFDEAVAKMDVGQVVNIHLMPEEAYGNPDPSAFFTVGIDQMPGAEELEVGQRVYLQTQTGQPIAVTVSARDESTITFDANHEMAGKELNFEIELLEAR